MIDPNTKLITILGPTASGKTDLALDLAERFGGEIICADSRTIYRGMDIGTAKPTAEEQARVPHHLLDVVDPGETLSVAAFKRLAENAIERIVGRGNVPFIVGGSGLYIDALLFDYQFPAEADPERRVRLDGMTTLELQELLAAEDPEAFEMIDQANRRRLIRAIETVGQDRTKRTVPRAETLILGLGLNKEFVHNRIPLRIEKMLERGLLDEVRAIGETYGWESEAMTGIAYRVFKDVVLGTKTEAEAAAECAHGEMQLVKKQLTWFKRNKSIQWLDDSAAAETMVRQFLQK
jgi:tRNA dimethylallyltransferase